MSQPGRPNDEYRSAKHEGGPVNRLGVAGLTVRLGDTLALDAVDLALQPGWTAIVGPHGAGKSTLLRVLAGLIVPTAGVVRLGETPLAQLPLRERAGQIAWLAQQGESSGELTVREVVRLGRLPARGLFDAATADDERSVDRALEAVGATPWQHRRLPELSGGERQRVLLARALAVEAPWLLLDEPTAHLDPPHQAALVRTMKRLARAGRGVVSVMHDLSLALRADRLVVMARGRVVAQGGAGEPALHAAVVEVFGGAVQIEWMRNRWVAAPHIDD